LVEGVKFRLAAYPKALLDIGRNVWEVVWQAVRFATTAGRELVWALWSGEIYPLHGTAIFDWRDGFLGFAGGVQRIVGRCAAAVVVSAFETVRLLVRWRYIGIPMAAVWWMQALSWAGILRGDVGNLVGILAEKLFLPSLVPLAVLFPLGMLRSRIDGWFPGLRAYFFKWLTKDGPKETGNVQRVVVEVETPPQSDSKGA